MKTAPDHSTRFTVRGYELDSYGHVNNAVYLNYFEHGRWELFRDLDLSEEIHGSDLLLVVTDVHIRYMRESRLHDDLEVHTWVNIHEPFLIFRHRLVHVATGLSLARAEIKTVFLDNTRKPVAIPDRFYHQFRHHEPE